VFQPPMEKKSPMVLRFSGRSMFCPSTMTPSSCPIVYAYLPLSSAVRVGEHS
jgi:hypothetical protein